MRPKGIPPKLQAKYGETVVEIFLDGKTLTHQELYESWKSDFYMITASNPFSQLLDNKENEKRNQILYDLLSPDHSQILGAIGRSPDGSWAEKGWVVISDSERDLVALAQKFEQNAIFKFSTTGKEIISCL